MNARNFLKTSDLYDSVEIVRDGKPVKSIPRLTVEATPKPVPLPRHANVIAGGLREAAEGIVRIQTTNGVALAMQDNAQRILELLTELDASLLTAQLEGSVRGKR